MYYVYVIVNSYCILMFLTKENTASERKRNLKSVRILYKNQSDVFPSLRKSVFMKKKGRKLTNLEKLVQKKFTGHLVNVT